MKATKYMDDEIVIQKGVELLLKGMGPLETLRFLNFPRERRVDSVKRHREWQRHLDKKLFFDDVFGG
jgi:hypothetical protein